MSDLLPKAIGGYFEFELPQQHKNPYPKAVFFQSARAAFYALLSEGRPKRVWMPSYICDSMLDPLHESNTEIVYYDIDPDFKVPDIVQLEKDDWFFYVNYFGICSSQEVDLLKRFIPSQVIFDHSQAFFSPPKDCLATIYSPRKFFGVSDGGLLVTRLPVSLPDSRDVGSVARSLHGLKRLDSTPEAGYQDFKNAEETLSGMFPKGISQLTERVLSSIDFDECKKRRNANFRFLHCQLGKQNLLHIDIESSDGAMCYPLMINDPLARERLLHNRIFVPIYWAEVAKRSKKNSFTQELLDNCLPLPCDHRYTIEDMHRIVECVKDEKYGGTDVYIRPLCEVDALQSCHWRNDPDVWTYTGSRPNLLITEEIELEWIRKTLKDLTSKRFAICITATNEYIGNVQLTNIENDSAQFHIFIGNKSFWGKGIATAATKLILKFALNQLHLKKCYLEVDRRNQPAIKSYEKNGFKVISISSENYTMAIDLHS